MPSTYTVNLGIEKPATGEQSGTWGDTTNVNFDILDQAVNGAARVTLTSAGTSGSPNTLAITNGATSDGRNKWVEFYSSSDLGGNVFVQLDPNDAEKIVFVRNSLGGSQSVILFQGTYDAGRDLEIPAGMDMVVKFDGGGATATTTNVFQQLRTEALNIAGDGATVTGIKDEDNMASNSATKLATQQSIKAYVDSQVGTVDTLAEILANGNTTGGTDIAVSTGDDITFADSSKAIFGAGSDLQIYHDGSDSIITDAGTGNLIVKTNGNNIQFEDGSGNDIFKVTPTQTNIYHGTSGIKLTTTSTGVDITGTLVSDGLTVDGVGSFTSDVSSDTDILTFVGTSWGDDELLSIPFNRGSNTLGKISVAAAGAGQSGVMRLYTGSGGTSTERIKIGSNGDITFYDTDGTTASFVYDANAGTTFNDASADRDFTVKTDNSSATFYVNGQYDGVGIHTSSPISYANAQAVLFIEDNTNPALGISDTGQARDWWIVGFGDGLGIRYADGSNTGSASNTVPAMFFKNTGFVGVGDTGAPLSGLHLSDGTNAGSPQNAGRAATLMIDAGATASADLQFMVRQGYNSHIFFGDASDPNVGMINYDHSTNHMNFTVNTTQALTIDDQGDVGIGNTDPTSRLVIEKTSARTNDAENMVRIVHNTSGTSAVGFGSKILFAGERSNGTLQNMGRIGFVADVNTSSNLSSALILEPASNGAPFEGMRISSSGNVGIGEQDPDSTLQLSNSSSVPSITLGRTPYSSHGNLTIGGTGTGHITSNIDEAGDSTVNVRASRVAVGNGEIDFQNSPQTAAGSARTFTTRLRVDEYGGLTIASVNATAAIFGGTNLVNGITAVPSASGTPFVLGRDTGTTRSAHFGGYLKFDNGYGIDFSAQTSTSASGTSVLNEALTHYERGTWTPGLNDSAGNAYDLSGWNNVAGQYIRIGDIVFANMYVSNTGTLSGSTTFLRVSGLPYASVNTLANLTAGAIYTFGGFTGLSSGTQLIFRTQVNSADGYIQAVSGGTGRNVTSADFGGAMSMAITFSYRAA